MSGPRQRLLEQRADTLDEIAALRRELDDVLGSATSTTGDDEHDPEGSTIGFERAQAQAMLDAATERLSAVDAALARVDAGTYGVCAACGKPIGAERLEARPTAERCIDCATAAS
ncbi:MAG TPA: TraR/DksA C4-type zinc finger protein [Jatrophihabitans sp.]|nr:TraR/DksA C4-type zinc finger protein [Jatrophihabitans sp.]